MLPTPTTREAATLDRGDGQILSIGSTNETHQSSGKDRTANAYHTDAVRFKHAA